ncbi:ribosomal protein S18-alanine N-acetyltransferase [Agitococcus lubricus]|uniref:[Ribosomal protein bS18]-alanine N-acetyltransferase n=1 Tax=Agitococcus lubricus TaxID=1077255 RepID=A0A2T5J248_9GAMM|nr:ribosomal protein S18-alanine N-acetyltransferase [Agitococcus lubricus]PTQ90605.1 [SSU ribosomal protein S18P]-alanine acetyltransferase [Agitococcus lubricus]
MVKSDFLVLRPMTEADLNAVYAIEKQVQYAPWSIPLFQEGLGRHLCTVAEYQHQIIGFSVVQFIVDEAHLLNIAIDPQYQKRGFAKVLLAKVFAQAQDKNASTLFLEVRQSNQRALAIYQMAGFNEIGLRKNYYPSPNGKEHAVIMAYMLF